MSATNGLDVSSSGTGTAPRVLLVSMPWASPEYPSLSLGLLKAVLQRDGIPCDTLYGNLYMLDLMGHWLTYRVMSYAAEGDGVFTPRYFGAEHRDDIAALIKERTGDIGYPPLSDLDRCREVVDTGTEFIDRLFAAVDWGRYDVIGFSLMFQQLLGSMSLARLIREAHPDIKMICGGPSCDDVMGLEILRAFPEMDYVVIGEGDSVITPVVQYVTDEAAVAAGPPPTTGVAYRDAAGEVQFTGKTPPLTALDDLPFPDFDDYFTQIEELGIREIKPVLYMETSRGCWWGQKSLCSFCGLNGTTIEFRSKDPDRAFDELLYLSRRHKITTFWMSDNILDVRAFKTLLPRLKRLRTEEGQDFDLFFEIKANVTKEQLKLLRDAGVTWVQPGIESFSDGVLELMHKGAKGIQQVQIMKFLAELGMDVDWNILYGNPNERPEHYDQFVEMIPFMHHLPPPEGGTVIQMNLHRFSRYHRDPAAHGIENVRAAAYYHRVYPSDAIRHDQLAFVFDYDHPDQHDAALAAAYERLHAAIDEWRAAYRPNLLFHRRGPGFVHVYDRRARKSGERPGAQVRSITLHGLQAEIYLFCDSAKPLARVLKEFGDRASADAIRGFLERMVAERLAYRSPDDHFLSLTLQDQTGRTIQTLDAVTATLEAAPAADEGAVLQAGAS